MWNEEEAVKKEKVFIVVNRSEGMWNEYSGGGYYFLNGWLISNGILIDCIDKSIVYAGNLKVI